MAELVKMGFDPGRGYRKCVGFYYPLPTKRMPRNFRLGRDKDQAAHAAVQLVGYWDRHLKDSAGGWTEAHEQRAWQLIRVQQQVADGTVAEVRRAVDQAHEQAHRAADLVARTGWAPTTPLPAALPVMPTPATTAAAAPAAGVPTVAHAATRLVDTLRARHVGDTYQRRSEAALKQLQEQLPAHTPLSAVDHDRLLKTVAHFTARPASKVTGEPLAVDTLKTLFTVFKQLLETCEDLGWQSPGWRRLFRIRWGAMRTPLEQAEIADGKLTFTDAELARLAAVANPRQWTFLLTALNTAMHQRELASLLARDVHLDATAPNVDRIRNKTRSSTPTRVCWSLWPELVPALRRERADDNPGGLFFLTAAGQPIVHGTTDGVMLTWSRLLGACNREGRTVRPLPFGTVRKTAATWIRHHAGEPVQQQFLGHVGRTVASRHYTGSADWQPLHAALHAYRLHLIKAGVLHRAKARRKAAAAKTEDTR